MTAGDTGLRCGSNSIALERNQLDAEPAYRHFVASVQRRLLQSLSIDEYPVATMEVSHATDATVKRELQVFTREKTEIRQGNITTI
jgi:hypothetical protein